VQHQERKYSVKAAVGKIQRAGVSDLERDPWVANLVGGMIDVDGGQVDTA
jgi:hypothetical protein